MSKLSASINSEGFTDIHEIRRGEVVATITERTATGHRSFKIGKTFQKRGEDKYSSFLSEHHLPDVFDVLSEVEAFLAGHR